MLERQYNWAGITSNEIPIILVGAFDRHNFGDMLFAHLCAKLLSGKKLLFAGLQHRDLRGYGGHQVHSLLSLADEYAGKPVHIVHAGGEVLTCTLWEAAVMLLPPSEADLMAIHLAEQPNKQMGWAQSYTGMESNVPYVVSKTLFPDAASVSFHAVGGMDLQDKATEIRLEVFEKMKHADRINVRDRYTQQILKNAGISSTLLPDSAVMVSKLFSEKVQIHEKIGEPRKANDLFPQGYVAVQFSIEFSDDPTLERIARDLDALHRQYGYGFVFFRAGAAPWHDDLSSYHRLIKKMYVAPSFVFQSLEIWDICALIARSRAYCGSSLHGLIVSSAFGRPGICLRHRMLPNKKTKQEAYVETWGYGMVVRPDEIAEGMHQAMQSDPVELTERINLLAVRYCKGFEELSRIFD